MSRQRQVDLPPMGSEPDDGSADSRRPFRAANDGEQAAYARGWSDGNVAGLFEGRRMGAEWVARYTRERVDLLALLCEYMDVDMGTGIRPRAEALVARIDSK